MTNEQQNKPTLIIVVLVAVLLIGGAFFFMKKSPTSVTPDSTKDILEKNDENTSDETSLTESGTNTLMGLMGMGKNLQCSFDYATEGKAGTKGTMYVSGKKVRGEFESDVDGQKTTMYMMQDGEYSYLWGPAMPEGIKMKVSVPEGSADTSAPTTNQYFDPNQKMDVDCSPWGIDPSKFVVPSDVAFRDVSAMMQR